MESTSRSEALGRTREKVMAKGFASGTATYVDHARGAMLYDVEGRAYIDFAGGIAVMNVGHSHPKVVAAIQDQGRSYRK